MTYREVGYDAGLMFNDLDRFVRYMTTRWGGSEVEKCRTGYAREWALRFLSGQEYDAADPIGQVILNAIDTRMKETWT